MADEPTTPDPPSGGAQPPQGGDQNPPAAPTEGDDGKGGKAAVLKDLAAERDKRQALEKTVSDLQKKYDDQWGALTQGLGIKIDPAGDDNPVDALTKQVEEIQKQLASSERKAAILQVAAAPGNDAEGKPLPAIPAEYLHLLENAPNDKLAETAQSIAGLVAAKAGAAGSGYASSAGQGQHGGSDVSLPAQIAATEKELQGTTPGSVEQKQAQQRLRGLKTQQLFQATQS